jgi:hypothetical protein
VQHTAAQAHPHSTQDGEVVGPPQRGIQTKNPKPSLADHPAFGGGLLAAQGDGQLEDVGPKRRVIMARPKSETTLLKNQIRDLETQLESLWKDFKYTTLEKTKAEENAQAQFEKQAECYRIFSSMSSILSDLHNDRLSIEECHIEAYIYALLLLATEGVDAT